MAHKEMIYIKGFAKGKGFYNTLKAISIATLLHEGQMRKSGEPYIDHPMRVTSSLIALKIHDDITLATAILHDVFEDCVVSKYDLIHKFGLDPQIVENIEILSKIDGLSVDVYYKKISLNVVCLLIKLADRCHNISTMVGGFTPAKMDRYIIETETYVYPLCHAGKDLYPEYSDQLFTMKYHIDSVINVAKALLYTTNKEV